MNAPIQDISPLKIILVGCGTVARWFYRPAIQALLDDNLVKLTSVVDPSLSAGERIVSCFPGARRFDRLEDALTAHYYDLAIIASPPAFHEGQSILAMEAGCNVLCEKPMASGFDACQRMIAASHTSERMLAIGHYKRYFATHRLIKSWISTQTYGRLLEIDIREGGKFNWPVEGDGFFRPEITPGGVLLDSGIHALDLLLWWIGRPQEFQYQDDARDGLEANCLLQAQWSNGVNARLRFSRDWPTQNRYAFQFERASVVLKVNQSDELQISDDRENPTWKMKHISVDDFPKENKIAIGPAPTAFEAQLRDVCQSISQDTSGEYATAEDGASSMKWVEECYANRVRLPEPWRTELLS